LVKVFIFPFLSLEENLSTYEWLDFEIALKLMVWVSQGYYGSYEFDQAHLFLEKEAF
jgi:hypothetical protein